MYENYPSTGAGGQLPETPDVRPMPTSVQTAVRLMYAGAGISAISFILGLVTIGSVRRTLEKQNPTYSASKISSLVNAALGKVAMQQNVDMRKISAWVAIAAVPTAVAGIYGMNFDDMPELHQPWGYPAALGVMLIICVVLYRTFRRNEWL